MFHTQEITETKSSIGVAKSNVPFFTPVIQKKLSVGASNDHHEVEADRVADNVMRMSSPSKNSVTHTGALVQRKCAACQQEEKIQKKPLVDTIQRVNHSTSEASTVPGHVESGINSSRGSGSTMDQGTKNFMESRFGTDFSEVKIHTGSQAVQMSRDLNAQAFTVGNDIYFNEGKYSPNSENGKHLLAHELTHTIQQSGSVKRKIQRQEIEVELVESSYEDTLSLHNRGIELPSVGTPLPLREQSYHPNAGRWNSQTTGRRPRRTSTKRATGFTGNTDGTYIRHIEVQIHPRSQSTATLYWANMSSSRGFTLPLSLPISPGAGNCNKDCSNLAQSQETGSHCTPLSPPIYTVQGFANNLSGDSRASYVTWYHIDRGIAFHNYEVPNYPASHGCTRLNEVSSDAQWIYDNSLAGITTVRINRDASEGQGDYCWQGGRLISRPHP